MLLIVFLLVSEAFPLVLGLVFVAVAIPLVFGYVASKLKAVLHKINVPSSSLPPSIHSDYIPSLPTPV